VRKSKNNNTEDEDRRKDKVSSSSQDLGNYPKEKSSAEPVATTREESEGGRRTAGIWNHDTQEPRDRESYPVLASKV